MTLPSGFRLSQGSLQDYVDCARRFQLRYVRRLRWPAIEVGPPLDSERHLQQGDAFHQLIRRHLIGLPVKQLSETVTDPEIRRWWRNYLESGPAGLPANRHPEIGLSAPVAPFRLVAQYDLVAIDPGERAVIVDWKTNRRRPGRETLAERLQTQVYPYLLVRAGGMLNEGERIEPRQVTMVYWFANFPGQPERFSYDRTRFERDHDVLTGLVSEIQERFKDRDDEALLPRTEERRRCRYCRYRSLCGRGVEAGLLGEEGGERMDEDISALDLDVGFDLEQIAEAGLG